MPKLDRPNELGTEETTDHSHQRRIETALGQTSARKLAVKYPESDQCGNRDERAERRQFKVAEPEQDRVHVVDALLLLLGVSFVIDVA